MVYSTFEIVIYTIVIVAGGFIFSELLFRLITRVAKLAGLSGPQIRTAREVYTLIWIGIIATALIRVTGLSSDLTTLTISGIAGIAISLALQTTLQNIIAGILLFNDKILRLSDEIEFSGVKGKVVRIGLRNAWIRTDDGTFVMVSNSNLANGPLVNHTAGARILEKKNREVKESASHASSAT